MSQLFSWKTRILDAETLYIYATIQRLVYQHDSFLWSQFAAAIPGIQSVDSNEMTPGVLPGFAVLRGDTGIIVVSEGTVHPSQHVGNILGIALTTHSEVTGKVHSYFGSRAAAVWPLIEHLLLQLPALPVTFCGHSLGGAVALIYAARWYRNHPERVEGVISEAAPRAGNLAFADALQFRVVRIENELDFVPDLPPVGVFEIRFIAGKPTPVLVDQYKHPGDQYVLKSNGAMSIHRDNNLVGDYSAVAKELQLEKDTNAPFPGPHNVSEYVRRLKMRQLRFLNDLAVRDPVARAVDDINNVVNARLNVSWRINTKNGRPFTERPEPPPKFNPNDGIAGRHRRCSCR